MIGINLLVIDLKIPYNEIGLITEKSLKQPTNKYNSIPSPWLKPEGVCCDDRVMAILL
jgi:hypothetical protein